MQNPIRGRQVIGPLLIAIAFTAAGCRRTQSAKPAADPVAVPVPAPQPPKPEQTAIPKGSSFVAALSPFHLDPALANELIHDARPVYNLGHIQAGHRLRLERSPSGAPSALSYQIDANRLLWLHAPPPGAPSPSWSADIQTIPYETKLVGVSGTVQSSLFQAVEGAGEKDELALDLANIFGWDLDFYTDTQQGDVFRALIEKKYLNGQFAGYGQVVAAEYVNAGEPYDAVRFHDDLGFLAYYKPDGKPMKREFLRSPLKFAARVSSGFSRSRFHPILKTYRPHLGVDYAAPTGTPVQTIGSGIVTRAGRYGGDGNMVQIRHSGGYQTLYLHLSRILVRVGERVAQGQRIGLVGMTGLATGPHLDFRIEYNGDFENFETLRKKLPPAEPVAPKLMAAFTELRTRYMEEVQKLQPKAAVAQAEAPPAHAPKR